ncbi:MAG: hypothetical protein RBG13Loki_0961 [Promethearchaeota archaeon CR_4]|nr:MAG: hypothetical protein RBG13Loki_0961 [Candidatus Lokiarchaeota archaeon CR_4]
MVCVQTVQISSIFEIPLEIATILDRLCAFLHISRNAFVAQALVTQLDSLLDYFLDGKRLPWMKEDLKVIRQRYDELIEAFEKI